MDTFTTEDKVELLQKKFLEVCRTKGYNPIRELNRAIDYLEVDNPLEEVIDEEVRVIKIPMIPYIREMVQVDVGIKKSVIDFTVNLLNNDIVYRDGLDYYANIARGTHGVTLIYLWDKLFQLKLANEPLANIEINLSEIQFNKIKRDARKYDWYVEQISIYILNTICENTELRTKVIQEYISNEP